MRGKKWIVPIGMKHCSLCGQNKMLLAFSIASKSPDGRFSYCLVCLKKKNSKRTKEQRRKWHLSEKYKITLEEYMKLWTIQQGLCAICQRPQTTKWLAIDHNHKTGKVRALLCVKCNTILGQLEDRLDMLKKIKAYLTIHQSN